MAAAGHALVTAGAAGAGLAIAGALSRSGLAVTICDIDGGAINALRAREPLWLASCCDASEEADVDALFTTAEARHGPVTVLVNNVGTAGPTATLEDIALADWRRTMAVNLDSHFLCARRAVPSMKRAGGGLIVNISSGSAKVGLPLRTPYVVSKAAVLSLTANLARELGPSGIRANAILPGAIRGPRIERVVAAKAAALGVPAAEYERGMLRYISMRTMVEPEDVASMVVFLASPAAARITGQFIGVDGGVEWEE